MSMPGGSMAIFSFISFLLPLVIIYILFRAWRLAEKRKEQREEMKILLLAKMAQKLGVEQSTISEIIKTL